MPPRRNLGARLVAVSKTPPGADQLGWVTRDVQISAAFLQGERLDEQRIVFIRFPGLSKPSHGSVRAPLPFSIRSWRLPILPVRLTGQALDNKGGWTMASPHTMIDARGPS